MLYKQTNIGVRRQVLAHLAVIEASAARGSAIANQGDLWRSIRRNAAPDTTGFPQRRRTLVEEEGTSPRLQLCLACWQRS